VPTDGDGDGLLTTSQAAALLSMSPQWMCKARSLGYGPRWVQLSPRRIRYLRSEIFNWLQERTHAHTREYTKKGAAAWATDLIREAIDRSGEKCAACGNPHVHNTKTFVGKMADGRVREVGEGDRQTQLTAAHRNRKQETGKQETGNRKQETQIEIVNSKGEKRWSPSTP
jgi:predicted DNA-binding transcriptional regulator AlpA